MVRSRVAAAERLLGVKNIAQDQAETWSLETGRARARDRRNAVIWYYGAPTLLALPLIYWHFNINAIAPILSGVAVFTALLFGLLVLIFNTGVTLRKDGPSFENAHDLRRLVADLRANVTYAAMTAMTLALVLVVAASVTPANETLAWGWSPVVLWLFVHLGLNLLTILRRFRTAFNYITR